MCQAFFKVLSFSNEENKQNPCWYIHTGGGGQNDMCEGKRPAGLWGQTTGGLEAAGMTHLSPHCDTTALWQGGSWSDWRFNSLHFVVGGICSLVVNSTDIYYQWRNYFKHWGRGSDHARGAAKWALGWNRGWWRHRAAEPGSWREGFPGTWRLPKGWAEWWGAQERGFRTREQHMKWSEKRKQDNSREADRG